jgi:hypothetical protein
LLASLVLLMAAARKIDKKAKKCGASSGHITNLEQSIFSFDTYELLPKHDPIFLGRYLRDLT